VEATKINFEDLINESLNNLKYVENAEKIKVNIHSDITFDFYSDASRVGAIINNLLSNGFKYHRFENNNPYINISVSTSGDNATLVVEDNGIGIEEQHIGKIFDMFYRASENSYGSGLGLYILKSAIHKINGKVEVSSILGVGSVFKVVLPNLKNI
jgi:signal transduction histidine kinase